jgi:putative transposase
MVATVPLLLDLTPPCATPGMRRHESRRSACCEAFGQHLSHREPIRSGTPTRFRRKERSNAHREWRRSSRQWLRSLTWMSVVTYPRQSLICLQATPFYHVVSRCVRRARLCGYDEYAGCDYSHRKGWVLERLRALSGAFAVDLCAYAVMSNHYHLVLHVDSSRARAWSNEEVVARWCRLFQKPVLIEQWQRNECDEAVRIAAEEIIADWRGRLFDVSWYMRCLNEHLARRANAEDECTGRFWEGRFKSQALLDEAGLLTAMAYVDLNPIRAGIAATPEDSEFTSICARIDALRSGGDAQTVPLLSFCRPESTAAASIPFPLEDYLELVDWSGRTVRADKGGAIDADLPPILKRLSIDAVAWQEAMQLRGNVFGRALGRLDRLRLHAQALGQSWIRGLCAAARLYRSA